MVLAHRERFERRKTQRELADERFRPAGTPPRCPTPACTPGTTPSTCRRGCPTDGIGLSVSTTLNKNSS